MSSIISKAPGNLFKKLQWIWFVRCFRRCVSVLVRTSLRKDILQIVNFNPDSIHSGSVIVSCHTPWARLITQWCVENKFAMIIGWGPWPQRANIAKHARGLNELRQLTRHLGSGGRVIIMADIFNDLYNCPVKFFEKPCNASLFPLRLAKAANASLISLIPALQNDTVKVYAGPEFFPNDHKTEPGKVMQTLLSFFESQIKKDPSVWSGYVRGSLANEI